MYTLKDYTQLFRPWPGKLQTEYATKIIDAGALTVIKTVQGKGSLLSAMIRINPTASENQGVPVLRIDSQYSIILTWADFLALNFTPNSPFMARLILYDETNYDYAIGFYGPITFEEELSLQYYEIQGQTFTALYELTYTIFQ